MPLARAVKSYRINVPINVKPAGEGGTGLDLIVFVGPGVKHQNYLVLPGGGGGYLNLSSPDMY